MDTVIEGVFNNTSAQDIKESLLIIDKSAEQLDYFPSFLTPDLGLPSSLHPSIFGQLDTADQTSGRSASAGCSDIYSVFAFLAFLFALLDFLLNMMENRKRRSTPAEEECGYSFQHSSDMDMREGTLAVYSMFRGMLNFMDTEDGDAGHCSSWAMCQAAGEAAGLGRYGAVVAVLGSDRAGWWLERMGRGSWEAVKRAGIIGASGQNCDVIYPCYERSNHYRWPGVRREGVGTRNKYAGQNFKEYKDVLKRLYKK